MSAGRDAPVDPRFANLDAGGTIDLCSSLADYGEAGGLSRDLMFQVGRFVESRFGSEGEVLLAVGRMYLHGGEAGRARHALVRAARLGLDEARIVPLLDQALEQLGEARSAERVLRDPLPEDVESERPAPKSTGPRLTTPMLAAQRLAATTPRSRIADTPRPAMPAVHKGRTYTPTTPRLQLPRSSKRTTPLATAAAQPVEDEILSQGRPVRTEISRRVPSPVAEGSEIPSPLPPRSEPKPRLDSARRTGDAPPPSAPLPARIRILDPDDERRNLDPYELIGELASGGMATVYLGRLAGAGGFSRFVAIKQLHPHLAREEQFVQMFLDEARLAAGIHNAHVVPILEVGMSKAGYFLVMEYIEGDTLAGLTLRALRAGGHDGGPSEGPPNPPALRSTGLPAPVGVRIVLDALEGLHAAHQLADGEGVHLGLVHRDCTPQNILVGVDGSARLTDFGVARAASRLAITRPQQVKGKVAYLSPEQAHAMDLDRRSDLFTMGIVLWEVLAGRSLFQADNEAVTLSRVVSGPIPAVRSYVPDLPPELDDVCRKALHRDRNKRFRTAAEMAEALELAAEGIGVASPREVGRFVEATMGADLIAQREAVRAGLVPSSKSRPSRPPPALRGSTAGLAAREEAAAMDPAPASSSPAADPTASPTQPSAPTPEPKPAASSLTRSRRSTARGVALAGLLLIVLTAPLWIKLARQILGEPAGAP
jgi:serine/threonine-protein kinase